MRYQRKSSISYMFRNFFKLVYVSLPAALIMAFAMYIYKPSVEIDLLSALVRSEMTMENYSSQLLQSLTLLRYGKYWWIFAIAIVVLACAVSISVVKTDRHMRTGQMPVLPMRRALGVLPLMLPYIVCSVLVVELGNLLAVGISYLIRFFGNATAIVCVVLGLLFAIRVMTTYVFGLLIMSFPLRYSENYRFNRAMSYSARMMFPKKATMWSMAILYPTIRLATLSLAYLLVPYNMDWLIYTVALLFAITYVPCLCYKQYYDDVGGERRDLQRKLFG